MFPTTADYANAAAQDAQSEIRKLKERVKELEARLKLLEEHTRHPKQ